MLDLRPAARAMIDVVVNIRDEQLKTPTPCTEATLGDLVDHVEGLSFAFAAAATKTPLPEGNQGTSIDASRLGTDWRERIPKRVDELAEAWRDESAWQGMTMAGGQDLPGELAGIIALNELIVHGWDIARASGQSFTTDRELVEAAFGFVQQAVAQNPSGTPGLFGPPVPVPDDAPAIDRLIGLAGRDPSWAPMVG
jgi:uncharacterized protein (TIGR03086 family)